MSKLTVSLGLVHLWAKVFWRRRLSAGVVFAGDPTSWHVTIYEWNYI